MNVTLIVEKSEGPDVGQTVVLPPDETVVGRMKDCGLRIASNELSRRHCILRVQNGFLVLEDLASLNGTYVNGQRVHGKHVVYPNDRVEVGPLTFRVEYELAPETLELPDADTPEALPVHDEATISSAE